MLMNFLPSRKDNVAELPASSTCAANYQVYCSEQLLLRKLLKEVLIWADEQLSLRELLEEMY